MAISYSSYTFPSPEPFVSVSDEAVNISGKFDYQKRQITLNGAITGSGIDAINNEKKLLVSGLGIHFGTLTVGTGVYTFVRPVSINFPSSNPSKYLPYEVTFNHYKEKSFTKYYGIESPKNVWSYQEDDGRIVRATHSVSAKGNRTDGTNPITNARTFVNASLGGFETIGTFLSGQYPFLISKTESIDDARDEYGVVEEYIFNTRSSLNLNDTGIVSHNSQIVYTKDNGLEVRLNGSVQGGLTGYGHPLLNSGAFTPDNARAAIIQSVARTKTSYETGAYGQILRNPTSYSYTLDEGANKLDFEFSFTKPDDERTGEVLHTYTTNFEASKDLGVIKASIDGEIEYNGTLTFFTGSAFPETQDRFRITNEFYSGLNPYPYVAADYQDFISIGIYEASGTKNLSSVIKSSNVSKDFVNAKINYNFSYDTSVDFSQRQLDNSFFTLEYNKPISKTIIKESLNGYTSQNVVSRSAGEVRVNAKCDEDTGSMQTLRYYCTGLMAPFSDIIEDNESSSANDISLSIAGMY